MCTNYKLFPGFRTTNYTTTAVYENLVNCDVCMRLFMTVTTPQTGLKHVKTPERATLSCRKEERMRLEMSHQHPERGRGCTVKLIQILLVLLCGGENE